MEWRLIFSGFQSPFWAASVVVAVVAAIVLFLVLRRYEAKLVPRHISAILLSLRVLALLLLLATLLQPVLTRAWSTDEQGRLIVGFDVSESMETADRHASPAEMLRWAQALGMLGNSETNDQIEAWIAEYDAGEKPDFAASNAALTGHIDGVFDEFRTMSRMEFVRRLLQAQPTDLLSRLSEDQAVELYLFALEHQEVNPDVLAQLPESVRAAVQPSGTNLAGILRGAIGDQQTSRVNGIVLFTDGRHTGAQDVPSEAQRLANLGVRVHCIPIGSRRSPRDLAVAALEVPQTVFLDDDVRVKATVSSVGYSGDDITVRLMRDEEQIDQRTVTVAGEFFDAEFDIPAEEAGTFDYRIETDPQPGELRDDNNRRDFSVAVVDNKTKVWLIDGKARWEFRYLNSALERDERVDLSTVLFDQPSLQLLNRTFLDKELPATVDDLREKLAESDILILGDVNPENLPPIFWEEVEKAVSNEGLTLLFVPGKRHMPHDYNVPAMDRLLPVTEPRQQLAERYRRTLPGGRPSVFRIEPSAMGREQSLLRLSDPASPEIDPLQQLPGHPWAYTGTPKPVASVWANLAMSGEDPGELPVIVHQYFGFGQVVWLGIDSTWRWRFRSGDKWHHRFWGQAVRWAARNKSASGNDQVRLTLSDVITSEADPVDVSVRWDPRLVPQLRDATVEVVVEARDGGEAADDADQQQLSETRVQLQPDENTPERFGGRLPMLSPGRYRLRLEVSDTQLSLDDDVATDLQITKRMSSELANISCNREFLQQIANAGDGRLLEPWQLDELPDLVRVQPISQNELQERTLWDHWAVMLLFFLLLASEWVLRKMHGLP